MDPMTARAARLVRLAALVAASLALTTCGGGAETSAQPSAIGSAESPSAAATSAGAATAAERSVVPATESPTTSATAASTAAACTVKTVAGKPPEPGADDGIGDKARFSSEPEYIAMDSAGDFYIGDKGNDEIRKMTPDGVVTTLAGNLHGFLDGVGRAARFNQPEGVAVDAAGNVYVADDGNDAIRKVTPAGVVTTLARLPAGIGPVGLAFDAYGHLYSGTWTGVILRIELDGKVTTIAGQRGSTEWTDGKGTAARFQVPFSVATDAQGVIWVADASADGKHGILRKVKPDGTVTTVKLEWPYGDPGALWMAPTGVLYVTSYIADTVMKVSPDRTVALLAGKVGDYSFADGPGDVARFRGPIGIVGDAAGLIYVVDSENRGIRTISCP